MERGSTQRTAGFIRSICDAGDKQFRKSEPRGAPSHCEATVLVHLYGRLFQIAVRETLTEHLVPVEGIATTCTQQRAGRHQTRRLFARL